MVRDATRVIFLRTFWSSVWNRHGPQDRDVADGSRARLRDVGRCQCVAAPQAVFGSQRCTFIGSEHFKPALVDGGTATGLTARLFGKLSGCSGTTGVAGLTITGGTLRASGTEATFSNNCAALPTEGVPGLHGFIKWRAGGVPVEPSTFDTSNGSASIGAGITLESPSPGPTPSEGDSHISGSYGPSGLLGTGSTSWTSTSWPTRHRRSSPRHARRDTGKRSSISQA